ncbi:unnamed protein product [Clonostachys rosea f. rosea IK726]|uniref:Uncharacterized protein n=1 Tax=Clonostachys rosea f. rosea IK726 TaxID=1349383 RepID=A0ACA9TUJ7_BIOOC|nr:unnamed protein product [Clonostachys rosea f. rosea IK726]
MISCLSSISVMVLPWDCWLSSCTSILEAEEKGTGYMPDEGEQFRSGFGKRVDWQIVHPSFAALFADARKLSS